MSQSPTTANQDADAGTRTALDIYANAWAALGDRVLRGQSFSGRERNCAFLNTKSDRFATVSAVVGFDAADDGRSIALTDWDQDGDVDIWVGNRSAPRLRLYRNDAADGRPSLSLDLQGTLANRDAIGARVTVRARSGGEPLLPLVRSVRAGDGFLGQHGKTVVVGLGEATAVDTVEVLWPSGAAETFSGLAIGGRYRLIQGSGRGQLLPPRPKLALAISSQVEPKRSTASRVVVGVPTPAPPLSWLDLHGQRRTWRPTPQRATLLVLFATWCAPCQTELEQLAAAAAALSTAGLGVVALAADEVSGGDTPAAVGAWLAARGWPLAQPGWLAGLADAGLVQLVETTWRALVRTRQPLALPFALLLDGSGRIAALYQGPVALATLRADLAALNGDDSSRRAHSAAAAGTWVGALPPSPIPTLDAEYSQAKLPQAALHALRWGVARDPGDASNCTRLASLLANAGDEAGAEQVLLGVLRVTPDQPQVHNNLANRLARRGQFDQAIVHYRKALAQLPNNAFVIHGLASALANTGQLQQALPLLAQAVQLDPTVPGAKADFERARALVAAQQANTGR
ncbi:MAG: tetratricopeptide repeat protein [Myxococcales bacterium]|nr:tetratricopeptide repeat protein [Myxococcales bacterium]